MSTPSFFLLTDRVLEIMHPQEAGCIYVMWLMLMLYQLLPLSGDDDNSPLEGSSKRHTSPRIR